MMGIMIQFIQINITWKRCADLPTKLNYGKTAVINGKVYCGGGVGALNAHTVYCYHPSEDKWTTLPPLPVSLFGLGQLRGKLVAVGGQKIKNTNEVYIYDEMPRKWMQTIPPMPTARNCMNVLNLQSALIVAGGYTLSPQYTEAVEIFKPDTSQWYRTDPLPIACCQVSLVANGNTYYALGGYSRPSFFNQALYASVDDLLGNAVLVKQTTHSSSSDTQSAWKTLPNTPTYGPTAAMLDGNLLTIGGKETSGWRSAAKKEVYMYSPSTNSWIHISDLPAPITGVGVAVLSSTEILAIGGYDGDYRGTVYKGTLHLKP